MAFREHNQTDQGDIVIYSINLSFRQQLQHNIIHAFTSGCKSVGNTMPTFNSLMYGIKQNDQINAKTSYKLIFEFQPIGFFPHLNILKKISYG